MAGGVIQGQFIDRRPRIPTPVAQPKTLQRPGPPAPAFAPPRPVIQRHGAGDAFQIDPTRLGLSGSGGQPIPETVRRKMEGAFGADFRNVRVHIGPQAERIGAVAFTLGTDIYFAPGRYQPETVQGQQVLGHELAHVMQQRAGRVRNPIGAGVAVVQDRALEAEAEHMGHRAASHPTAMQPKMSSGVMQPFAAVQISPPISAGPNSYRLMAAKGGRQVGSVMVHTRERGAVEVTDLGVDPIHREHGIGKLLLASAARAGQRFGKSKVILAAQDKGSGHLTRWYKEMGFTQIGMNNHGYPQLEVPISRLVSATVQSKMKEPGGINASYQSRLSPGTRSFVVDHTWGVHTRPFVGALSRRAVQRMETKSGYDNSAWDEEKITENILATPTGQQLYGAASDKAEELGLELVIIASKDYDIPFTAINQGGLLCVIPAKVNEGEATQMLAQELSNAANKDKLDKFGSDESARKSTKEKYVSDIETLEYWGALASRMIFKEAKKEKAAWTAGGKARWKKDEVSDLKIYMNYLKKTGASKVYEERWEKHNK